MLVCSLVVMKIVIASVIWWFDYHASQWFLNIHCIYYYPFIIMNPIIYVEDSRESLFFHIVYTD